MPNYVYLCPQCGEFEQVNGYEASQTRCDCGMASDRLPCSGVQIINRTGDLGRPATWTEKRKRERNAYTMERVSNNTKRIQADTSETLGPR